MSRRILDAWRAGLLDGFSIMANGDAIERARSALADERDRQARIAAHVNLNEGKALLKPSDVPLLTDSEGYFTQNFAGMLKLWLGSSTANRKNLLDQVEREWRAQIHRVQEVISPRKLTAIDSHTHIHMIPFLFGVASRLARDQGVPEIRITAEPFYLSPERGENRSRRFFVNIVKHAVLQVCSSRAFSIAKRAGIGHPDAFIGVLYSGMMAEGNIEAGISWAERRGVRRFEILLHIGRATEDELQRWRGDREEAEFALSPSRDIEYESLIKLRAER
jgi:hypothetical protein